MKDVSFANCLLRMRDFHQHLELDSMIGLAAAIKEDEKIKAKADAREAIEDGEPDEAEKSGEQ